MYAPELHQVCRCWRRWRGAVIMLTAGSWMLGCSEHEWGDCWYRAGIPLLSAVGHLSQFPRVCLFHAGYIRLYRTGGRQCRLPPGHGIPPCVMVFSRRVTVGVDPGADRPVLGRDACDDTIQGDTIQSDCHPLWEVEQWPHTLGLSL